MPFFINPTLKRTHNILCFNIMFLTIKITNNISPQHNLLINCISAKSAYQILSIKDGFTFLFSNFLITVIFSNNSFANFYLRYFHFERQILSAYLRSLTVHGLRHYPEFFYRKKYKLLKTPSHLISFIFWIFGNIKQYFIRNYFSS